MSDSFENVPYMRITIRQFFNFIVDRSQRTCKVGLVEAFKRTIQRQCPIQLTKHICVIDDKAELLAFMYPVNPCNRLQ